MSNVIAFLPWVQAQAARAAGVIAENQRAVDVGGGRRVPACAKKVDPVAQRTYAAAKPVKNHLESAAASGAPPHAIKQAWDELEAAAKVVEAAMGGVVIEAGWAATRGDCRKIAIAVDGMEVGRISILDGRFAKPRLRLKDELEALIASRGG